MSQHPAYRKTTLANGLRVVTEHIQHVRSASIGAWVTSGSRNENEQNNGISHYIEHMMFKGTKTQTASQIAQSLESVGGHLNAFTGKELTCYYAHVLDEHVVRAVDVISDFLANSLFDEAEMVKEKRVVLEELSNIEETPEELIHEIFWRDLFPNHPLGYPIIGNRSTITNIGGPDIADYLDKNYTADRVVLAAAGNVNHDKLVKLAQDRFGAFQRGSGADYEAPVGNGKMKNVVENGSIQAHICLGTQAYSYRDKRKFALLVLNTFLGSGMSSRLFQNVREKHGLAYSIYSFIDFMADTGIFGVYVGTDPDNIDGALDLIHKELRTLKESTVQNEELQRTKSQLKGNLMLGLEDTSSRMNRLAKMELFLEDYFSLDDTLAEIEKVTAQEILDVAGELFDFSRMQTTILKPAESK